MCNRDSPVSDVSLYTCLLVGTLEEPTRILLAFSLFFRTWQYHDPQILICTCSRHGFSYIRGWMQMVMTPNDLFSWNNIYNEHNVTVDIHTFFLKLCTWTYSVQARLLKPWWDDLPRLPAISSFCHVFPPPLSGLNWRSLSPFGGPGPSTSKMAPLSTGSAHTPLQGFRTVQ